MTSLVAVVVAVVAVFVVVAAIDHVALNIKKRLGV